MRRGSLRHVQIRYELRLPFVERTLMARTKKWSVVLMALLAAVFVFALLPTQALARTGWYEEKYEGGWSDWFYYGKNGKPVKGWQKISGKWYFFDEEYGWMYDSGSFLIDGKNYVFSTSGALIQKAGWQKFTYTYGSESWTTWYYTNSSGVAATGWKKISGSWYYFWPDYGGMAHDSWIVDGGKYYAFGKNGAMATNAWYKATVYTSDDGELTGWWYLGSNGAATKGWQKVGGSWYYMDAAKGAVPFMISNTFKKIGSKTYYFNKNGAMATGWKKIGSAYYYFNSDGTMATKKWVGNYYLKEDGTMAVNEWIDGKYHVNKNGKWDKTK